MTVTVYSKDRCVQCDATKKALDKEGIPYNLVDVGQDQEAFAKIVEMGYRSVPVVTFGEDHWGGFDLAKIRSLKVADAASQP